MLPTRQSETEEFPALRFRETAMAQALLARPWHAAWRTHSRWRHRNQLARQTAAGRLLKGPAHPRYRTMTAAFHEARSMLPSDRAFRTRLKQNPRPATPPEKARSFQRHS